MNTQTEKEKIEKEIKMCCEDIERLPNTTLYQKRELLQAKLEGIKIGEQSSEIEIAELKNDLKIQLDCNVKLIEQREQLKQKVQDVELTYGRIKENEKAKRL
jgi:flagellin-like hook-associated protein FlgL